MTNRERSLGNIANSHYVKVNERSKFAMNDASDYSNRISTNSKRYMTSKDASSEFIENRRRNNIQYSNLFNIYQETKRSIERGDLTSQRMQKLLRPRQGMIDCIIRDKHTKDVLMRQPSVDTIDQKVRFVDYILNAKRNVFVKHQQVSELLDRYKNREESLGSNGQTVNRNVKFLGQLKLELLRKKKMKHLLHQHLMEMKNIQY